MGTIVILGSANAVPDQYHENTHLLIQEGDRAVLVDCTGNPIAELNRTGVSPDALTDIILTHFHPDHVSGVPLLLMDLWLLGRRKSITIHGLADTVTRMKSMMDLYDWRDWPNFFSILYHPLPEEDQVAVLRDEDFAITASPVKHLIPTLGIRVEFQRTGKVMAFSSDTEPCQSVIDLAQQADLLIHEATGSSFGHSLPRQAGEVAQMAGAKTLSLIHYPTNADSEKWLREAKEAFDGPVSLATDYQRTEI
ncbi:metal-dependent hydrolases of the beta-lactamase superfamily III [Longilinea arvoryzae]|uniref:Metal-dependent hydrolases of the beta-lactamase superfamily III n=1 Tax=Longilinea arvoryzae TaxID=360412 RepID=A0A0S7BJ05_9CHLR|nr:MBL fold metallo-hydrolase [Longilinea arvoryzae]GAP15136.1 metal-dependent hydrolases of the beta-lactamase superfamily III [Longilinea arvoryzae]